LFDLLYDVPALVSEENAHLRSPITGKPIISPRSKGSILIPAKPIRKQLERRSQSNDTFLSHGWSLELGRGVPFIVSFFHLQFITFLDVHGGKNTTKKFSWTTRSRGEESWWLVVLSTLFYIDVSYFHIRNNTSTGRATGSFTGVDLELTLDLDTLYYIQCVRLSIVLVLPIVTWDDPSLDALFKLKRDCDATSLRITFHVPRTRVGRGGQARVLGETR